LPHHAEGVTPHRLPGSSLQDWFFGHSTSRLSTFNITMAWRFLGQLDHSALRRALRDLCSRHEALRTTLSYSEDPIAQLIWPQDGLVLKEVDLSSGSRARSRFQRLVVTEARAPFDLRDASRPLARASLVTLGPADHVLILVVHHAIADGWSCAVLFRDIQQLYNAAVLDRPSSLAPLDVQFGDYAAWEQSFESPRLDAYWRGRLGSSKRSLRLPQQPATAEIEKEYVSTPRLTPRISPGVTHLLRRLAGQHKTSFAIVLCAGVVAALSRYALEDVTVAVVDGNRDRPELQPVVGWLVNLLLLQVDTSGKPTFHDLVMRAHEAFHAAYDHRIPFATLRRLMSEGTGQCPESPFDVVFNYLPYVTGDSAVALAARKRELRVEMLELSPSNTRIAMKSGPGSAGWFDYNLRAGADGDLGGYVWGNERVFAPGVVLALGRELMETLRRVSLRPEKPVRDIVSQFAHLPTDSHTRSPRDRVAEAGLP
jgi:condensation domain-containing protein